MIPKTNIAEFSRNVMKYFDVKMLENGSSKVINFGIQNFATGGLGAPLFGNSFTFGKSVSLGASVNNVGQASVLKTLAEPALRLVSGEQATPFA